MVKFSEAEILNSLRMRKDLDGQPQTCTDSNRLQGGIQGQGLFTKRGSLRVIPPVA